MDMVVSWNAQQIFAVVYWPVLLIMVPYTISFWVRRKLRPIRGRFTALCLAIDVITISWTFILCFKMFFQDIWPCLLNVWDSFIAVNLMCVLYLSRTWLLLINYNTNEKKIAIGAATSLQAISDIGNVPSWDKSTSWQYFLHHLTFTSQRTIIIVTSIAAVVTIAPLFAFTGVASPPGDVWGQSGCNETSAVALLAAELVVYALIFIGLAFKFRSKSEDNFGIKQELRISGYVVAACVIPYVVFEIVPSLKDFNNNTFRVTAAVPLIAMTSVFIFRTIIPVHMTFKMRQYYMRRMTSFELEQGTEMKLLLTTSEGFVAFSNYLAMEFSSENIMFWDESRKFRQFANLPQVDTAELLTRAGALIAKYIETGAVAQINVTYGVAQKIISSLQQFCSEPVDQIDRTELADLFLEAERHVFGIMLADPFPRFIKSPLYNAIRPIILHIKEEFLNMGPDNARMSRIYDNSSRSFSADTFASGDSASVLMRTTDVGLMERITEEPTAFV